jgi:hypothetical protein
MGLIRARRVRDAARAEVFRVAHAAAHLLRDSGNPTRLDAWHSTESTGHPRKPVVPGHGLAGLTPGQPELWRWPGSDLVRLHLWINALGKLRKALRLACPTRFCEWLKVHHDADRYQLSRRMAGRPGPGRLGRRWRIVRCA